MRHRHYFTFPLETMKSLHLHMLLVLSTIVGVVGYLGLDVVSGDGREGPDEMRTFVAEEIVSIGDDETKTEEYLLGSPFHVASDSADRIYIFDRSVMGVRAYDADGQYQQTIGRPGQGPGELRDVAAMYIDQEQTLWTLDNFNFRITRFSLEGEVLTTHSYTQDTITWPRQMRQLDDERYVLLYRLYRPRQDDLAELHMLHVFEEPFEEAQQSFASTTKFGDLDDPFVANMLGSLTTGSFAFDAEGNVLVVPFLYEGKIFRYAHEASTDTWHEMEPLKGHVKEAPAYTRVHNEPFPDEARVLHSGGAHAGIVHNESLGVFTISDGRIVHFTFIREDDQRVFGMELYSPDGQLQAYGPVEGLPAFDLPVASSPFNVTWKNEQDHFYLIDRTSFPAVRVVSFDL